MASTDQHQLLQRITAAYPHLSIATARLHTAEGQFNDILIVNEALIFRFPRSPHVAATLAAETALLTRLQGHVPLPTPNPNLPRPRPTDRRAPFHGLSDAARPAALARGVRRHR